MEINLGLILASVINFIILLAILKHFFFGKVKAIIDEREDYINDRLDSAEEATDKARMIAIENERALNRAKEEGKAISTLALSIIKFASDFASSTISL